MAPGIYSRSSGRVDEKREVSIAHATSPDLMRWDVHPDVIQVAGVWPEIGSIFARQVVEHGGRFFMLYTASDEWTTQRICLAISEDLFTWERYAGNPVIIPSPFWSRWPGHGLPAPARVGSAES